MYDIIGDIHGHADELIELLEKLGYAKKNGTYAHPTRQVLFLGDFIDRGPKIREVLSIARSMVEGGTAMAVMGNHEFNAIAFHTRDPKNSGRYLRDHSEKNCKQHQATTYQLTTSELADAVSWFRTLPMSLELEGLRAVHATWNPAMQELIAATIAKFGEIGPEFMQLATDETSDLYHAIEEVLKGREVALPNGMQHPDKDGNSRSHVRVRWFDSPVGQTFSDYVFPKQDQMPAEPSPKSVQQASVPYPEDDPPVFFGHYWLNGDRPQIQRANVACLDFSVAKGGALCAYRWSGETQLQDDCFEWVSSQSAPKLPHCANSEL